MNLGSSLGKCCFIAAAVLSPLAFSNAASAQQGQAEPIWGVNCAGTATGLDCRAIQFARMTNTGQLSLAVHMVPETKKPTLLLLLPLAINLPTGVALQFGQGQPKTVSLKNCDPAGCLAEYAITDAELAALIKGEPLTVSVQGPDNAPITVQVPATGFAAAYAKIK